MKRATVKNLRWDDGLYSRITIESSALRFHVGETIEVVFADVIVTGYVLSAKRLIGEHPLRPRAEYTVQVSVEAEGDAEACICIPTVEDSDAEPDCPAVHAVTVDIDSIDLHFN